ncbi:MAG: hypothetical protein FWC41_09305 [Firmicutes bacterium]|nr:hypothetical protein [Bacillota bacterium]
MDWQECHTIQSCGSGGSFRGIRFLNQIDWYSVGAMRDEKGFVYPYIRKYIISR